MYKRYNKKSNKLDKFIKDCYREGLKERLKRQPTILLVKDYQRLKERGLI